MRTANTQNEKKNYELYIMDADGENQLRLTNTEDINEGAPSLSADGSKIVFICQVSAPQESKIDFIREGGSISVMGIDGGNRQDFSFLVF